MGSSERGEAGIAVRSLALRFPAGHRIDPHRHPWGQMVYATQGVMTVGTDAGAWVVPSHRAAWVPGDTEHWIETTGSVRMRTIYLRPDMTGDMPRVCCVLSVSALLRELVLEVLRVGMLREDVPGEFHLARVLVDQMRLTPVAPLDIRWPQDGRARWVADRVQADLSRSESLERLARGSGASVRTLERLFQRECGMTFGRWRRQAQLLHSLRRLAAGDSVTDTALSVGFNGTSAFIAMFRRALGSTPGSAFRDVHPARGVASGGRST